MTIVRVISRIIFFCRRYNYSGAHLRIAACAVIALVFSSPLFAANTVVRMEITHGTTQGTIDIELYDDQAPITVANFLRYAGRGDYTNNGFIHRHATIATSGVSVLQGGGYIFGDSPIGIFVTRIPVLDPPIQNEFSALRSNTRGTIAMAKLGGQPDSATSEWYINLADNSAALDDPNNSGGFTVFGCVLDTGSGTCTGTGTGMNVVDAIAALPIWNATSVNGALGSLPLDNFDSVSLQPDNFVKVTRIPNVTAAKTWYGTTSAYAADVDMTLLNPYSNLTVDTTTSASWLATFTPPPGKTVEFNDGISTFTMTGTMGPAGRVVTLYHGVNASVNRYYAYGPTPGNATPHWYDFSYDATTGTGAEFVGDKILLHFVDGQRGDNDSIANSITHTGAPALETDITIGSSSSSGCSIAATPSQMTGNGDWVIISLFLAFVALVRKRTRRDRIQRASR